MAGSRGDAPRPWISDLHGSPLSTCDAAVTPLRALDTTRPPRCRRGQRRCVRQVNVGKRSGEKLSSTVRGGTSSAFATFVGGTGHTGRMLLSDIASAVEDVAATPSRRAKTERVASVLRRAEPHELPVVVRYLEGELPQRRTGLGWRALEGAPEPAAEASLGVADADAAFAAAEADAGPG